MLTSTRARPSLWHPLIWAALALAAGIAVAGAPLRWSAVALAGVVVLAVAVWRPLAAVVLAVGLGVTKAFLARLGYGGILFDFGQIFLLIAITGWATRKLLARDFSLPPNRIRGHRRSRRWCSGPPSPSR